MHNLPCLHIPQKHLQKNYHNVLASLRQLHLKPLKYKLKK